MQSINIFLQVNSSTKHNYMEKLLFLHLNHIDLHMMQATFCVLQEYFFLCEQMTKTPERVQMQEYNIAFVEHWHLTESPLRAVVKH